MIQESDLKLKIGNEFIIDYTDMVGDGEFGAVYRGYKISSPEEKVAIKVFRKQNNKEKMQLMEKVNQKEQSIYEQLKGDSQYLVHYYKTIVQEGEVYLVMELCDNSLADIYLRKNKSSTAQILGPLLPQNESFRYFIQILLGLNELYARNIIHRDLKFQNILLKQGNVKIGDFGFGKIFQHVDTDLTQTCVGTGSFMAPEIQIGILQGPNVDIVYGSNVDIWSLGVMFYYMLYGVFPQSRLPPPEFGQPTIKDYTEEELNLLYPKDNQVKPQFISILKQMLVADRFKRIKLHQLLELPLVKEGIDQFCPKIDLTEMNRVSKAQRQIRKQLQFKFQDEFHKFQVFLNSQREFINQTGIEVKLCSKLQLKQGRQEIFFAATSLYLKLMQQHFYPKITLHLDFIPAWKNKEEIGGYKGTEAYRKQLTRFETLNKTVNSHYGKIEANLKDPKILTKLQKDYTQIWQWLENFSNSPNPDFVAIESIYDKLVKDIIKDAKTKIFSDPQLQKEVDVQKVFIKLHFLQPEKIKLEVPSTHPKSIEIKINDSEVRQRWFDDLLKKNDIQC